jgi:hypothetical protein
MSQPASLQPPLLSANSPHEIDYRVHGDDRQIITIDFAPCRKLRAHTGCIVAAVPPTGWAGREEGWVLGGLGRLIDGDNS